MDRFVDEAALACAEVLSIDDLSHVGERLRRAVGGSGSFSYAYVHGPEPTLAGDRAIIDALRGYMGELFGADPVHPYMRSLGQRYLVSTADPSFDDRAFARSEVWRRFYRPLDLLDLHAVWLTDEHYGDPGMVGIVVGGAAGCRGFDRDAARALAELRAPLRAAARRVRRFERLREERVVLERLLARGASAVDVLWNREGRRIYQSALAVQVFQAGEPRAFEAMRRAWQRAMVARRVGAELRRPVRCLGVEAAFFVLRDLPEGPLLAATLEPITADAGPIEALTEAELRVVKALAQGGSNREIADRLDVSTETVRTHARRIYRKLGVRNRTEAALRARDLGLLERVP